MGKPRQKAAILPESNLGEGEGLYRLLVEAVQDYAIFALDQNGYVRTWNPGAERFKGYQADEIIGRHFSRFFPPEAIADGKPERLLKEALRLGHIEDAGWRVRRDGRRFWANVVITALHAESGRHIGFVKITRDMTEQREAAERLRQSEERFRLLVQNVKDYAIFLLDPEGRVTTWNEGATRMKGYTAKEIIGQHFSIFYPAAEIAAGKAERGLATALREGSVEDEGWRIRKDGTRFWANVVISRLHDPEGKLIGFAKVTRDLTERRAAEHRAIADARRLAASEAESRTKGEFLTAMSHELRTPLNAIGGYVDLLKMGLRGPVTPEQVHDLERITRSQRHLLALINDILNYSRLDSGQIRYRLEAVPVGEVVEVVAAMAEPQAVLAGIDFEVREIPQAAVQADRTKLEQVLLNLLSNALKFTGAGGRITLSGSLADDVVHLTVTDTGVGIPEEKMDSIFEPFVQLGRSLTTTHEGTGLGLAISRDLARGMGGDLRVASTPGKGAEFVVELPKA